MPYNNADTQDIWRLTGKLREPLPRKYRYIRQRRRYYWIKASYPVFPDDSPVGAEANKIIQPFVKQQLKQVVVPDNYKRQPLDLFPYSLTIVNTVSICRRGLISAYFDATLYTGGANEWSDCCFINLALKDGFVQSLSLYDLVRTLDDADVIHRRYVEPRIYEAVQRRHRRSEHQAANPSRVQLVSYNRVCSSSSYGLYTDNFVLTPTAIMWIFQPGDVDAYAFGTYTVKVSYAEIKSRLAIDLNL